MPLAPSYDVPGYFADDAETFLRAAPVFLGGDAQSFSLTRPLRADDAFDMVMSEREAEALKTAELLAETVLGKPWSYKVADDGLDKWYWVFRHIQAHEAWQNHGAWITGHDPQMTPGVRERFEFGRDIADDDLRAVEADRRVMKTRLREMIGDDGVLILPTVPSIAPKRDIGLDELQAFRERALCILCISGNSGLPQVSLPLSSLDDCPLGLSLIGPPGSDVALIKLGVTIAGQGGT